MGMTEEMVEVRGAGFLQLDPEEQSIVGPVLAYCVCSQSHKKFLGFMYRILVEQTGSELERAQVCDFVVASVMGIYVGADAQGDDGDAFGGRRDDDPQGEDDGGQVSPLRPPPPLVRINDANY